MKPIISPWLIYFASIADSLKILAGCILVCCIIAICIAFIMMVANELTSDNVQAIGKTGKDVIDYITDQIDKVVNDKEEDKK